MKFRNGFAALVLAAGLMIGMVGVSSPVVRAQTGSPVFVPSDENTITVQGTGDVQTAPDIARADLGVVTQNADLSRAAQENAAKSAALIKAVKSLGIADKDIETLDYLITPQNDYSQRKPGDNSPPQIVGYKVDNTVLVTVRKIADVGKVLDVGVKAGANTSGDLTFDLNDDAKARAQTDALTRAVANARSKADTLAKAAGVSIVSLYSVSETGNGPVRPMFAASARLSGGGAETPTTPVQPGQIKVSATITVKYRIR